MKKFLTPLDSIKRLLGIFFAVSWIAGQLLRLPGLLPVVPLDAAVTALVLFDILKEGSGLWTRLDRRYVRVVLVLLASWLVGLRLFPLSQSWEGLLYALRFIGYGWIIARSRILLWPIASSLERILLIFLLFGLAQFLFLPDTRFLFQYGWDEHYWRVIGTVLDPNYLGAMVGIIAVFTAGKSLSARATALDKVILALAALTLLLTFSRASWLAALLAFVYLFWQKKRLLTGLSLVMLGTLLLVSLLPWPASEGTNIWRTKSLEQRVVSWRQGARVWIRHPWIGVGFDNYHAAVKEFEPSAAASDVSHSRHAPDNSWIFLLATTGMVGTVLLVPPLWPTVRKAPRLWQSIFLAIAVHSLLNNTLFYSPLLGLVALIRAAKER